MRYLNNKYSIRIPNNVIILHCIQKNVVTAIGPLLKKSLKLKLEIKIFENKKIIFVLLPKVFTKLPTTTKKKVNSLKGTTVALIKHLVFEASYIIYKKLKFFGVGYRAFEIGSLKNKYLMLKLGYSHLIYFQAPNNLNIFCMKLTKLFVYGNSFTNVAQTASSLRSCKTPEPYKGKGILYYDEKIILKKGKKSLR